MRLPITANAPVARAAQQHREFLLESGCVPPLTKALCATMVAALNFCNPSLIVNRKRARELGADAQMLNEIWNYAHSERYTGAQKAALAAAVALTREARGLPDPVWNDLRAHFDDAQIVELLCVIGMGNYLDRVDNALQT